jgi:hypothetical protein
MQPADLLLDATVARGTLYLLVEGWAGVRRLDSVDLASGRQSSRRLCEREGGIAPPDGLTIDNVSIQPAGGAAALPGLLARRKGRPGACLVIYYHGGPDVSIKDVGFEDYKSLTNRAGCDTLSPAYSGSAGGGAQLSRQLKQGGFPSLDAEARAVREWVAKRPHYKRVAIVGVSFGGAPALALKKAFGPAADAYLVGPVVSLKIIRDLPPRTTTFLGFGPRDYYFASADMLYGSVEQQDAFDRGLAEGYRSLGAGGHVFAGTEDDKSPPDALKPLVGAARLHVRSGNHDVTTGLAATYTTIADLIAGRAGNPPLPAAGKAAISPPATKTKGKE